MLNQPAIDRVFTALGDPTRRAIVARLCQSPASVSALARPLDITLAAVVQHLQTLERSGLVKTTKTGRVRMCQVETKGLRAAQRWLAARQALWERRLDRLGEVLGES